MDMDFPTLPVMLLPAPSSVDLQNPLSTVMVFRPRAVDSCQGLNWFYYIHHYLEVTGLIKKYNGLLKTQHGHQLGVNTEAIGFALQDKVYTLIQRQWYLSPIARIYESANQYMQVGMAHFTLSPNNSITGFSLPCC